MSKNVITVDINDSMSDAIKLLKENDIKMLPVMKKDKLVGIITDRDLKRASASDATSLDVHELLFLLSKIKIKDIMTKDPIMIPQDFTVEETAEILLKNKISGAPVIDNEGQVVGAITQTDLFKVLISLTGVGTKGIQFAFLLKDEPGSIKVIADEIRKYGGRMVSILTSYQSAPQGYRRVYIRMYDIERAEIEKLKEEQRQKGTLLYVVDHKKKQKGDLLKL
jgi:acetoin utilization protein AcuB